ncbi:MAG: hypothetical protein Q4G50_04860 [Corynebacterium sp.]|uniref:hypothetical protein n=1 Tax=Corynebacterium sp. TaxID=1720 RepID=UPI0026E0BD52|nr:hypothetical protein [Corynebacterium sp.]MDO5669311.1 hypothetical protein [Corynebacterium sp.]
MRTRALIAVLAGALTLTACGGATVDNDAATTTSVAPLERAPKQSTTTSEAPDEQERETPSRQQPRPADPEPQDRAAREVDEVPESSFPRTAEDVAYLGELSDEKIDVDGVEDQLIGTAATVCDGHDNELLNATLPAVAGQLIEQGRTDQSVEEVTDIIESAARSAYC